MSQNRDPRSSYRPGTRPYSSQQAGRSGQSGYSRQSGQPRPQRTTYSNTYPPRQDSYGRYASQPSRAYSQPQRRPEPARRPDPRSQYAARRPAPQRKPARRSASGKSAKQVLLGILKGILGVILAIFGVIGALLGKINRKLDVFRTSETTAVIVNCALGAIAVCAALCIFLAVKPGLDANRAESLAAKGDATAALRIVSQLESKDYDAQKLLDTQLAVAEKLIGAGKHAEANSLLADLPESAETAELNQLSKYSEAEALYQEGKYSAAAQIFYQMKDYRDASGRYADCRCALAIEAYQQGNETSARSLLLDVPDVALRVQAAAVKIAGSEAGAQQILSAELFNYDNLAQMEQTMANLASARSDMPEGRIAAGKWHTLGLSSNGTVYAAGDNSYGQLSVSSWNGIQQVAAGAYHSVGLRADGTVVAVGDNSQNQCDVSSWTDIVAVAAAAYDTIGLKSDGSVVACGMHAGQVSGWHGVTHIAGGSYSLGCLYDKGAMLSTHSGAQMDMGVTLYDLSVCGPVSVGVLYDGTLVSTYENAPQWGELVSATAMETGILGIDVNGQVRSFFYRPGDAVAIAASGEAVEVESSGTHHVVLTSGGRVSAFGNNDFGQCNTQDWVL